MTTKATPLRTAGAQLALCATLLFALAHFAAALPAQQQGPQPLPPELGGPNPREKMLELFARVEQNLLAIDDMLYEASAGAKPLENAQESGLLDLLRNSIEQGNQVLEDIDEILEIAQSQQQSQSSSSGESSQSDGSEPKGGQQNSSGEQGRREQTPETPDQVQKPESSGEGEQQKQPGGEEQQQGQPKPNGQTPDSPQDSEDPNPENRQAGDPPPGSTERIRVIQDVERWGSLPIHVREIFSSEGGSDQMPAQYRDWIESYYRRLSRSSN